MPDDRFAQRVLYSRPYYVARYRLVVRPGDGPARGPGADGRRGGGRGARAEGARGAVLSQHRGGPGGRRDGPGAGGLRDLDAGPLAGPRALAGQARRSCPPPSPSDRFPICAAVRKADGDLKDAIDRAWDELDRSGRLAQVFARWHIPYDPVAAPEPGETSHDRETSATPVTLRRRWAVLGACWLGLRPGLRRWRRPGRRPTGRRRSPGAYRASARRRALGPGPGGPGGRPGAVPRPVQRLSRRRRPRRQGPRPDRRPLDPRRHRRRHRPRRSRTACPRPP